TRVKSLRLRIRERSEPMMFFHPLITVGPRRTANAFNAVSTTSSGFCARKPGKSSGRPAARELNCVRVIPGQRFKTVMSRVRHSYQSDSVKEVTNALVAE